MTIIKTEEYLEKYRTGDYEQIFRYFMELFVISYTKGRACLEFYEKIRQPILPEDAAVNRFFLKAAVNLDAGDTPEVLNFFIDTELAVALHDSRLEEKQIAIMVLLCALLKCFYVCDLSAFMDYGNLWPRTPEFLAFVNRYFYANLPDEVKRREQIPLL